LTQLTADQFTADGTNVDGWFVVLWVDHGCTFGNMNVSETNEEG